MATITITPVPGQGVFEGNAVEQVLSEELSSGHPTLMAAGTAVAVTNGSQLVPADASSFAGSKVLGLLHKQLAPGESGRVIINGATPYTLDPASPALSPGQIVYLSASLPGAVTGDADQAAGSYTIPVGKVVGNTIYVEVGEPAGARDVVRQVLSSNLENGTASEILAGSAVYSDADGRIAPARADSVDTSKVMGFSLDNIPSGASGRVVIAGEAPILLESGLAGVPSGVKLFLSASESGRATSTPANTNAGAAVMLPLGNLVGSTLYVEIGPTIHLG